MRTLYDYRIQGYDVSFYETLIYNAPHKSKIGFKNSNNVKYSKQYTRLMNSLSFHLNIDKTVLIPFKKFVDNILRYRNHYMCTKMSMYRILIRSSCNMSYYKYQ